MHILSLHCTAFFAVRPGSPFTPARDRWGLLNQCQCRYSCPHQNKMCISACVCAGRFEERWWWRNLQPSGTGGQSSRPYRGTCGQRGEAAIILSVTQEQDWSLYTHPAWSQPPTHQSRGEGLEGCIRGGRRHPPRCDGLVPRRVQAEPQCEDKPHSGNGLPDRFPGVCKAGKGVSGGSGLFLKAFPILLIILLIIIPPVFLPCPIAHSEQDLTLLPKPFRSQDGQSLARTSLLLPGVSHETLTA